MRASLNVLRGWRRGAFAALKAGRRPYSGERVRRNWPFVFVALIVIAHILIFTKGFLSGGPDVEKYYYFAVWVKEGFAPYKDFVVEYPPLALLIFQIPYFFGKTLEAYGHAFTLEMLAFDLAGIFLILGLARRLKLSPWTSLAIYTLVVLAVSSILVQRYDLPPAIVTLGALFAFSRGRYKTAWALLAIGALIKLYPALLAPIFLIYQWRHQRWQSLVVPVLTFVVIVAAVALPFYRLDSRGFIESFTIQGERSLQIESTYSSVLLIGYTLGLTPARIYLGQISFNLEAPLANPLAKWSLYVMGAAFLVVYLFYFLSYRRFKNPRQAGPPAGPEMAHLLNYAFIVVAVMILTNKVLSPQYLAWLTPLVPLVTGRARPAVWVSFFFVGWMTWYIYPAHYGELVALGQVPIALLFLRNFLLFLMVVWLWGEKRPALAANDLALQTSS
jgi:uncharacterized membrane protein